MAQRLTFGTLIGSCLLSHFQKLREKTNLSYKSNPDVSIPSLYKDGPLEFEAGSFVVICEVIDLT